MKIKFTVVRDSRLIPPAIAKDLNLLVVRKALRVDVAMGDKTLSAWAFCSVKDNWEKAKGKRLAFARAIVGLPKAQRKQLWEEAGLK